LTSYCLSPVSRNSVLEKLRVKISVKVAGSRGVVAAKERKV